MTKKKKKKKTELHVVKSSEEGQASRPVPDEDAWNLAELTDKLRKARKRIKKLENALTVVNTSYDTLVERHAELEGKVETLDTRTTRMGTALRECMKQLGVERPS